MHRLIVEIGWPFLALAALLALLAIPTLIRTLIRWIRFEIQLSRRAKAYEERSEAARVSRVRW